MMQLTSLGEEFRTLDSGDRRLNNRAISIIEALGRSPAQSFPKCLMPAELEGLYRFVRNDKISFELLLSSHMDATFKRMHGLPEVVVAHDTTDFRFSDEVRREGLGPMDNGGQGFYAHFALAIESPKLPLGILGVEPWVREPRDPKQPKPTQKERYEAPDKESLRWLRMVESVEKSVDPRVSLIHVMDREADDFDLFAELRQQGRRFVIRACTDRRISTTTDPSPLKLKAFGSTLEVLCERVVNLAGRPEKGRSAKERKRYPARSPRPARLAFRAGTIRVQRPDKARKDLPAMLELNVIYVDEIDTPPGFTPVHWILFTSEPVSTVAQVLAAVEYYCARWMIEEYFKALKTGCAFEERQQESKAALLNVLGLFIPIAWSLLHLRTMARDEELGALPADRFFTPTQLKILAIKSKGKLPAQPTLREALHGVARFLGGHLKGNGEPGWLVLGRGYVELLLGEAYWHLALEAEGRT